MMMGDAALDDEIEERPRRRPVRDLEIAGILCPHYAAPTPPGTTRLADVLERYTSCQPMGTERPRGGGRSARIQPPSVAKKP